MATTQFNRDSLAKWYATQHLKTDPGLNRVYYLPTNADEREIRLIEVNELLPERSDEVLEPIDFGIDTGTDNAHKLFVLDLTPRQWKRIISKKTRLPAGWSLDGSKEFQR